MFVHEKKVIAASTPQPHKTGKGFTRIDFWGAAISPPHATSYKIASSSGVWPLVLLLVACGGGGGGGGGGSASKPVIVAAIPPVKKTSSPTVEKARIDGELYDPPIEGARVYIDVNRNQQVDSGDILVDDSTDNQGRFEGTIPVAQKDKPLIADNRNAKHVGSSNPLPDYFMAPAGSDVISPLTHVIYIGAAELGVFENSVLFRDYKPLADNIYDPNRASVYAFENSIKRFLEDLTNLIITYSDPQILKPKIIGLISTYDNHLRSVVEKSPVALAQLTNFDLDVVRDDIDENTDISTRTMLADLVVTDPDTNAAFRQLNFSISDTDRFEIEDGVLYLKADVVLDHERAISHKVTVTLDGTDLTQTLTLNVGDITDEVLVALGRDASLVVDADDGLTHVGDGEARIKENSSADMVLYKVTKPVPDVAGHHIYFYLSGADAALFNIDGAGNLRLRARADHETPRDDNEDNIYDVTIHAREVVDAPSGHNLATHLAKAGDVDDASHAVTVTIEDVNDTAPAFSHDEPDAVAEDVALGTDASIRGDGKIVYTARATPDMAGDDVTYSLKAVADHGFYAINSDGEVWFIKRPDADGGKTSYSFTVKATVGDQSAEQDVTITITDINDTALVWDDLPDVSIAEGKRDTGLNVATAVKGDAAGQNVTYAIVDAAMQAVFEIVDDVLRFKQAPDFDDDATPNSYDVEIRATSLPVQAGGATQSVTQTVRVTVTNQLDEALTVAAITDLMVDENGTAPTGTTQLGVTTQETGDLAGQVEYRLAGGGRHDYVTVSEAGVISLHRAPNYESTPNISFSVEARYKKAGQADNAGWSDAREISIAVGDVNEAPTGFTLSKASSSLDENTDTSTRTMLADLMVTDPDTNAAFRQHNFSLSGDDKALFEIHKGGLYLKAGAVLRPGSYHIEISLDVSGIGPNPSPKFFFLQVVNVPEPPVVTVMAPEQPFTLTETDHSVSADTGWRVAATDPENNLQGYRFERWDIVNKRYVAETRFEFQDGGLWIKAGQKFDYETNASLTLRIFAIDRTGLESAPVQVVIALEDINDDSVKITAPVFSITDLVRGFPVDENIAANNSATERGAAYIVMRATATKDDVGPDIVWSLEGADKDAFGINSAGEVWFRESPDYESSTEGVPAKQSYEFTIVATSGSLSDRQYVKVRINDVDEVPSAMKVITILTSLPERYELPYDGIKVAEISFKDDGLGNNGLVRKLGDVFSYRVSDGVHELWLDGDTDMSAPRTYTRLITPDVSGTGTRPLPQIFTFTITNVPEKPNLVVTEDTAYRLIETASSTAQPTGFRVSATDPDPNETVTFSVHGDTRFYVRDGKLWVKAGQRFNYESEPSVTLTITATDNSAERLSDEQQITVQIANDLTESPVAEAKVPVETLPTFAGRKLAPFTITTKWRGASDNIGLERIGNWDVQNQDGGNVLTLKIRFDDGDEMVVARLVRDDAQSAYTLDTSKGAPALNTKFAGKFAYFQITRVASKDATAGESVAHLKWKFVLFGETGTGAPVNRLRPGESATEQIGLITQSDAHETNRDEKKFTFTFQGKNDRPIFLESDSKAQTSADDFPVTVPADGVFPNWPWWQEDKIVQLSAYPARKDITVDRSDGLVWRFVPVDVDGDYFRPTEDGAPRDYGDIANFVARYIRFTTDSSRKWSLTHQYFEVVQAVDDDGNPRFITMPYGGTDKLPILDLRLKSNLPDESIPTQYLSLVLLGGGVNFSNNWVMQGFTISLREVYGRDGQQDVFNIMSNGMPEENAPIFVNFEDGRDLIDMGSRDTVWWKLSDDGKSTILYADADGSNEKVLAIMRGFVANRYNLTEADFRFDYPVFGITVNPISHVSSSAGSQGTVGQRDDNDTISGYTMLPDDNLASAPLDFI